MMPILNKPFMEHTISYLGQFGIKDIILTLNYLPDVIQEYFNGCESIGARLAYCLEEVPLGTAGAVKNASRYLDDTFIVLNGDIFSDLDISRMLAFHRQNGAKATISLCRVENPSAFGVIETDSNRRVRRFIEKPPADKATTNWINAGTYILEPEVLEDIPENSHYMFEHDLFPRLLEKNEAVYGFPFTGYWLDMGTPEKYLSLNCDILSSKTGTSVEYGTKKDGIYYGRDVSVHPSTRITGPVVIGDNCRINREVSIEGPVVIGENCRINEGARLKNTILWKNVCIGSNARLTQSVVGNDIEIGPNDRIENQVVTVSETTSISCTGNIS